MPTESTKLVIVTGLSGAGKTQAVRCLEDLGFFCVDNLPPDLIPGFAELLRQPGVEVKRVALVMDIRGGTFFNALFKALSFLEQSDLHYEILFLEAGDEALVRRYKETRRRHPLSPDLLEGIRAERKRMEELRGRASKIIDTSELTPQQLREQIRELYGEENQSPLVITVVSFGYKYGIPLDADLVMDVRFLPNPHYLPELRDATGQDQVVKDYVLGTPATQEFLGRFTDLLRFLVPYYVSEGKSHLVIAIGCTGGQHRSVVLAESIGSFLEQNTYYRVSVKHRDVWRSMSANRPKDS